MTKEDIFEIVKRMTAEVLPDVPLEMITIDKQLKDLGANSIDRVEIVMLVIEELGIHLPVPELGSVRNLHDLVDRLYANAE